jgi:methylenetetrahydrofolate--tRNA-(uracil-5-)-methyltransferase
VIGGGLAGSEAAWQIAKHGFKVSLYEMRPVCKTAAHQTDRFAELVCSNSFGSDSPHAASRILKDELQYMDSFILSQARKHSVAAGASLAVDRDLFSQSITDEISKNPLIEVHREEIKEIPEDGITIIATGPLTSPTLSRQLSELLGTGSLYFYDAISPIVSFQSLDCEKLFFANRYDKGETADFLNIPLTQEQYDRFVGDLLAGEVVLPHDFEEEKYFESCMPIEAIASRGHKTLSFGPMKPVGLTDPRTGRWPYAVIQLRAENRYKTAYNMVGFQTKLKYGEQTRIFKTLPGLENAEFLRLGSMHRNTYVDSPRVLQPTLQLKKYPSIFLAGQITGTEGYLESSAMGYLAGVNAALLTRGESLLIPPPETMIGSLVRAITDETKENFQPLNSNMGILPPLEGKKMKSRQERNEKYSTRSQQAMSGVS